MKKLLTALAAATAITAADAATVAWDGGSALSTAANWTIDDTGGQIYAGAGNISGGDVVTVGTGTVDYNGGNLVGANGNLTVSGSASLTGINRLDRSQNNFTYDFNTSGNISASFIDVNKAGNSRFNVTSGNFFLSSNNAIQTSGNSLNTGNRIFLLGDAGDITFTQTGIGGTVGQQLFGKVNTGFFNIDGTVITGGIDTSVGGFTWNSTNIGLLNTSLATQVVDGRHLKVEDLGGSAGHKLSVVAAVPEPSTTALFGLGGLALILRRRK